MGELYKKGVKGKLYRLTYELNKENVISVKTPVGQTDFKDVGECLGQGTNEGAVISTVNLDGGIEDNFKDSETEVELNGMKFGPCLFQDDIARLAGDLNSVRDGNKRVEEMAECKLLDFNLKKYCFLIIGNKSFKRELMKGSELIQLCSVPLK